MPRLRVLPALFLLLAACPSKREVAPPTPQAATPEETRVERGRYLAEAVTGCLDCHSERDFGEEGGPVIPGAEYAGGAVYDGEFMIQGQAIPGRLQPPNITQHEETGIGAWSDTEILRSVRQGIGRNDQPQFPLMPYLNYRQLTEDDASALVAFLRTIPAKENRTLPPHLMLPETALADITGLPPAPMAVTDTRSRGEYLATIAGCGDCHTPQVDGRPDRSRWMAGGVRIASPRFDVVVPNLTPDADTGMGKATEVDFFRAMREGIPFSRGTRGHGEKMHPLMPWIFYRNMTDADLHAIWIYLQSLPPVRMQVE